MNDEKGRTYTRGEFLGLGATLAAGAGLGLGSEGAGGSPAHPREAAERLRQVRAGVLAPDLVLVNARVYTVDDDRPRAEAFAVKDGYFAAVGSGEDVRNLAGPDTDVVDAGGMTVTPGFIDTHNSAGAGGIRELTMANLDVRSLDAIAERLRAKAAETPPGEWVVGYKYDDTKVREGRQITREDLDRWVPHHPVKVMHRGGHINWYNSLAFERARVTVDTPDPPGGRFYRRDGVLDGKVAETANRAFSDLVPGEEDATREQRRRAVDLISRQMTATGLTSIHDDNAEPYDLVAYHDALRNGELRFRMYMLVSGRSGAYTGLREAGVYTGFGGPWLKVGGVKYGVDGSASGRTMAMSTPYVGRPDDYGILTMTQEETNEVVEEAHRNDWQIGIHANGDVAIELVLNAYERAQRNWPRPDPRHRIEHCTLVNPEILRRIKEGGFIPTPFWTYVHYHGDKWGEYGEEKLRWMFAHRSFLDHGIPAAGASDYVPGPYPPLMAIQSCVTRKDVEGRVWGPNQRISVDEAIRVGTINGAYASFEEDVKGSITPGKYADYVVLARDPHEVDPDTIKEIQVVRTVVGGWTVHEA